MHNQHDWLANHVEQKKPDSTVLLSDSLRKVQKINKQIFKNRIGKRLNSKFTEEELLTKRTSVSLVVWEKWGETIKNNHFHPSVGNKFKRLKYSVSERDWGNMYTLLVHEFLKVIWLLKFGMHITFTQFI